MQKTAVGLFILSAFISSAEITQATDTKHPPEELTATTDMPQAAALPAVIQANNQLAPAASASVELTTSDRQGARASLEPEQVEDEGQRAEAGLRTPLTLPYDEDAPIPEGYRLERRSRRGLVIAGSIVGGVAYGWSLLAALGDGFGREMGFMAVPLLGPWLSLARGQKNCDVYTGADYRSIESRSSCANDNQIRSVILPLDGLMQIAGAAMLTVGLTVPTTRLVYRGVSASVTPAQVDRRGYGVIATGNSRAQPLDWRLTGAQA